MFDNLIGNCGNTISGGYNVGCGTGPTDLAGPPLLAPLGDFGGPTPTRPSFVGGPGIDLIPPGTPGACDGGSATDQRGSARPSGAGCDSGAVEGDNGSVLVPLAMTVDFACRCAGSRPHRRRCAAAGGACTLRAAVDQANAWPSADTVTIGAGVTPVLALAGAGEDGNRTGDLDSTGALTVVGNGATIDGGSIDRVLDSVSTTAPLAVISTTVRRGNVVGRRRRPPHRRTAHGHGSRLADNRATGQGGAVFGPTVTITTSTLEANRANGAGGGARAADGAHRHGQHRAQQRHVGHRAAVWTGPGSPSPGPRSRATEAQSGGGVATGNAVDNTITDSTIRANRVAFGGGGVFNNGTVTILRSTVDANRATLADWGSGGGIQSNGPVDLTASTVSGNSAAVRGGGIAMQSGALTALRSTIHANVAGTGGGGVNLDVPAHLPPDDDHREPPHRPGRRSGHRQPQLVPAGDVRRLGRRQPRRGLLGDHQQQRWLQRHRQLPADRTHGSAGDRPRARFPRRQRWPRPAPSCRSRAAPSWTPSHPVPRPCATHGWGRTSGAWPGPSGGACDIGSVEGDNGIVRDAADLHREHPDGRARRRPERRGVRHRGRLVLARAPRSTRPTPGRRPTPSLITAGVDPVLSIPGDDELANATGDLDLFDAVTIDGNGATIHGERAGAHPARVRQRPR